MVRTCFLLGLAMYLQFAVAQIAAAEDSALVVAIRAGDITAARAALDAGGAVNAADADGTTPLHVAAVRADGQMVALLLERGADPARTGNDGYRAFDYAIERDNRDAALALLEQEGKGGGADAARTAALAIAAAGGDLVACRALLAEGVAVDARGPSGYGALALASRWGHESVVEALLSAGATADRATESRYRSTPLMEASRDGNTAIGARLIAAGAQVDTGDRYGDHALNWAAYFGHAAFVAMLLEHHPDLERRGQTDDWPLEIALRQGHAEVARLLTDAGARARPGKDQLKAAAQ